MKVCAVVRVDRKRNALLALLEQRMLDRIDFEGGPRVIEDNVLGCLGLVCICKAVRWFWTVLDVLQETGRGEFR
jgi:hypothetical protein